jgi:hypothetical protein
MRLTFGDGTLDTLFLSRADRPSHISPRRCLIASMKHKNVSVSCRNKRQKSIGPGSLGSSYAIRCENVSGRLKNDRFHLLGLVIGCTSVVVNGLDLICTMDCKSGMILGLTSVSSGRKVGDRASSKKTHTRYRTPVIDTLYY